MRVLDELLQEARKRGKESFTDQDIRRISKRTGLDCKEIWAWYRKQNKKTGIYHKTAVHQASAQRLLYPPQAWPSTPGIYHKTAVAERLGRLEKLKDEFGPVKNNSKEPLRELLKISGKETDYDVKIAILTMLAKTNDESFLRRFAAKHGLKVIRHWMRRAVETPEHTITNPLGCVRLLWRSMRVLRSFPMDAEIYDLMVHEINLVPVLEEILLYKPGQNGKDDDKIQGTMSGFKVS
ncbi:hypothetical protein HK104_000159 [Borealophlyctis nickersoniae]|nr:hypothetical protein HK104_000159 [Borealophlyctis nickersoniae]